jgi:ABC-type phosphate/phosphonate transport system substrate-binding protein
VVSAVVDRDLARDAKDPAADHAGRSTGLAPAEHLRDQRALHAAFPGPYSASGTLLPVERLQRANKRDGHDILA